MYKIIDDFLDKESYELLSKAIKSETVPWYFRAADTTGHTLNKTGFFGYGFYNYYKPDHAAFDSLILPILKKLNSIACVQVRANLCFRDIDAKESAYHIDYDHPFVTTGILYLTNCNGKTILKNSEKEHSIDSIENRMLLFPAQTEHKLIYQTDVHKRYVINFNFIGDKNYGNN